MASELAVWSEAAPPEEGRKPSSRPVDLVHLSRYTLGERALEREVLQLFCTQSTIYLERLREAKSDKDWTDAAHNSTANERYLHAIPLHDSPDTSGIPQPASSMYWITSSPCSAMVFAAS